MRTDCPERKIKVEDSKGYSEKFYNWEFSKSISARGMSDKNRAKRTKWGNRNSWTDEK